MKHFSITHNPKNKYCELSTEYLIKTSPGNYEEKILLSEKNKVENAGVKSQNEIVINLYLRINYIKIYTEKVLHNDTKESESY